MSSVVSDIINVRGSSPWFLLYYYC